MRVHPLIVATFVSLWLVAAPAPARAALFSISLDTSGLVGQGEFQIDFQLIDGDGELNTQVVLRDFVFGTGAAGVAVLEGGAAESPAGTFTLRDTALLNAVLLPFTPGNALSFLLEVTGNSGPTDPDYFTMALLGPDGLEVPTLGFAEELLSLALIGGAAPESFGTDPDRTNLSVPAPAVTAVPEPATGLLVMLGALMTGRGVRRRRGRDARRAGLGLP